MPFFYLGKNMKIQEGRVSIQEGIGIGDGGGKSLKADDYEAAFNNLVWMILDVADKTLDITPLHKEDASKSQEGGKGGGFLSSLLG